MNIHFLLRTLLPGLLFCFYTTTLIGQTSVQTHTHSATGSDSIEIRLRYQAGKKAANPNTAFWDSLIADAHSAGLRRIEEKAYLSLGALYRQKGINNKALDNYHTAYHMATAANDNSELLSALIRLSDIFYRMNKIKRALGYAYDGLRIAEHLGDSSNIAAFYNQAGLCYFSTKEIGRSLELQKKSLAIYWQRKDTAGIVATLMDLGSGYHAMKQEEQACTYYLACKKYASTRLGDNLIELYNVVSAAYNIKQQYDSALKYAERAYEIGKGPVSKRYRITSLTLVADINYKKGNNQVAIKASEQALALTKAEGFMLQVPELTRVMKNIYLKDKDYKKALDVYELHVSSYDSLTSQNNRKQALEKEFNYQLGKKESENKLLAQKYTIQSLELRQGKYVILGISGLALAVLLIGWLFFRQNKLRTERKSEQLEQKLLRTQMNPHFIFNSLQAIQYFILKEDKIKAERYLSSFASVMRNVLENSRLEAITLKKEISLLENYLQLQKLRFGNRFDYEIIADEQLNSEIITVPPMLAQPFVENAVEHGLHGFERDGKITVSYTLKNEMLMMEITDNGHGMKDEDRLGRKHRSLATEITKERIALMDKKVKEKVSFTVSDAFPDHAERKGVKICFMLPLSLQHG